MLLMMEFISIIKQARATISIIKIMPRQKKVIYFH